MRWYTAVIKRNTETGLLNNFMPGFYRAHSQGENMEEWQANHVEVIALILEDGEPHLDAEFVGTQTKQFAVRHILDRGVSGDIARAISNEFGRLHRHSV